MFTAPAWVAFSVPLPMLMSSRLSPFLIAPVTTAPPLMFSLSAPAPKSMSPLTTPFSILSVSAPEPSLIAPTMAGSLASGTPSLSVSTAVLPAAAGMPYWRRVTPLVLADRSMAVTVPVTGLVSVVLGVNEPMMEPALFSCVRVPDWSRMTTAEP